MKTLYIWRLEQNQSNGYDTYDSCVVVSESEEKAKGISPGGYVWDYELNGWYDEYKDRKWKSDNNAWANSINRVKAAKIGIADPLLQEGEIICASFNAG